MQQTGMRIGRLAKLAGIAASALRYYEEAGLLGVGGRTEAGYRIYGPEALGRLKFIQRAKALGLSLGEIRQLVDPSVDASQERDRLRHLVAHKLAKTKSRIVDLQTLERDLESLYVRLRREPASGCGHLGDCDCWLATDEEVKQMAVEVACCGERCCPACACTDGQTCDCPECPCCLDRGTHYVRFGDSRATPTMLASPA